MSKYYDFLKFFWVDMSYMSKSLEIVIFLNDYVFFNKFVFFYEVPKVSLDVSDKRPSFVFFSTLTNRQP